MKNKHSVLRANAPTPRTASAGRATEEGSGTVLALTIIAVVIGCTVSSFHSSYGSGQCLVLLGYTG